MTWTLHVSASAKPAEGRAAWAARLIGPDGVPHDVEDAAPGASAYRARLLAVVGGLRRAPPGVSVDVHTTDDTTVQIGNRWLRQWQANRWRRDGGKLKDLDVLQDLAAELDARDARFHRLSKRDTDDARHVSERAKAACADSPAGATRPSELPSVAPAVANVSLVGWTDGGCRGNPGIGGWGFALIHVASGTTLTARGGAPDTTNNRMELQALIELLRAVHRDGQAIEVRADSKLVIETASKWLPGWKRRGWKKADGEPPANLDLVQALDAELKRHRVTFTWVKGHDGDPGNELADRLCNEAMDAVAAGTDPCATTRAETPPFAIPGVPLR